MKNYELLVIQAKLKLAKYYPFSVAIYSRAKFSQTSGKSRGTLKFWKAAISKYIQLKFLLCYVKSIDLQNM